MTKNPIRILALCALTLTTSLLVSSCNDDDNKGGTGNTQPQTEPVDANWQQVEVYTNCDNAEESNSCRDTSIIDPSGNVNGAPTLSGNDLNAFVDNGNRVQRTLIDNPTLDCIGVTNLQSNFIVRIQPELSPVSIVVLTADKNTSQVCYRGDRAAAEELRARLSTFIPGTVLPDTSGDPLPAPLPTPIP